MESMELCSVRDTIGTLPSYCVLEFCRAGCGISSMSSKTDVASSIMALRTRKSTRSDERRMRSALGLLKGSGAIVGFIGDDSEA